MISFRKSSKGIDGFLGDGTPIPREDVEKALSSGEPIYFMCTEQRRHKTHPIRRENHSTWERGVEADRHKGVTEGDRSARSRKAKSGRRPAGQALVDHRWPSRRRPTEATCGKVQRLEEGRRSQGRKSVMTYEQSLKQQCLTGNSYYIHVDTSALRWHHCTAITQLACTSCTHCFNFMWAMHIVRLHVVLRALDKQKQSIRLETSSNLILDSNSKFSR